jgi:hypothetical protein
MNIEQTFIKDLVILKNIQDERGYFLKPTIRLNSMKRNRI